MNVRPSSQPRFLWQGLLIVLPAAALTAFGILALRQDEQLIQQQAMEEARALAERAKQTPGFLAVAPPAPEGIRHIHPGSRSPDEDSIFAYAGQSHGWALCWLMNNGELLYPLPRSALPQMARSLAPDSLTAAQRELWRKAETSQFVGSHPEEAIRDYQAFLTGNQSGSYAALALYRLGILLSQTGSSQKSADYFHQLRRDFPDAMTDSGVPLTLWAALSLLELARRPQASTEDHQTLVVEIAADAVNRCPLLASSLLAQLARQTPSQAGLVDRWQSVLEAHDRSRRVHEAWRRAAEPIVDSANSARWIESEPGDYWLCLATAIGTNRCLLALSESQTARWIQETIQRLNPPAHLGVELALAGKAIMKVTGDRLATVEIAASPFRPQAQLSVRLTAPEALFARQRVRTYWFGGLVCLSAATILLGLASARRAFRQQQQLSDMKGNFVSSVSHELRAPLAAVRLMAEELHDAPAADAGKRSQYHGFIVQECRRLSVLIENVLDFSRHEQGRRPYAFEPTDLTDLLEATVKLMRIYATQKGIIIQTQTGVEPIEVEADGRALQQLLVNLIDNAIKHSPPQSTIQVGVARSADPLRRMKRKRSGLDWLFRRGSWGGQESVQLWVEDQGEGIPLGEQERIFERFYRAGSELHRATQGVGLGLAIVKQVAEAHHAKIHLRSAVGQGSRFTIHFDPT